MFNIFLEIILSRALHEVDAGVVMSGHVVNNLRFADEIATVAENECKLQTVVNDIDRESTKMGIQKNIDN